MKKICPCQGHCQARDCGAIQYRIDQDYNRLAWLADNDLIIRQTKTGHRVVNFDFTRAFPEKRDWRAATDAAMEEGP